MNELSMARLLDDMTYITLSSGPLVRMLGVIPLGRGGT
jgi:hypothetical protein